MKWKALVSTQNLKLAWRRINTGRNLQYKRFFREAYLVYESALDHHIRELHRALAAKAWQPTCATRIYLPKPSGLQRPLSLLDLEDQIVLQAVANRFAAKLYAQRQRVELHTVFSNKLASPKDSIFFLEQWQQTYGEFQKKCQEVFAQGYRWSAHFDLAAFYDTISHKLLLEGMSTKGDEEETKNTVQNWLGRWSSGDLDSAIGHGIPQGPVASGFLSEAFLLPIDRQLQKASFKYMRYVDDIRLFGRSESEVREAAIFLEQQCRNRGLIPQSSKCGIKELSSAAEAMGSLPSIPPQDGRGENEPPMKASAARKLLAGAIASRPYEIKDKSRFRFVMYRAPADSEILGRVLRLLPRHPEHIDAMAAYFGNYRQSRRIVVAALDYLASGVPYSYVRGELWHMVARLAPTAVLQHGLDLARQDARRRSRCVALSWGVMHYLMRCESAGLAQNDQRLSSENPISLSLLAPLFCDMGHKSARRIVRLLKGRTLMEQFAGARAMQRQRMSLADLGLRQRDLRPSCIVSLKALGVIQRQLHVEVRDYVGDKLTELYNCVKVPIWRTLLGAEYEFALQVLIEAAVRYPGACSDWLSLQDSFGDLALRQFMRFLSEKRLPGHMATANEDRLVKYGRLIVAGSAFQRQYPQIADPLRSIHNRRNTLPGSHPYADRGGSRNRYLTRNERDALTIEVKSAFDEIAAVVAQHT